MNRSGNIGAAKDMDSVFANFTDEEIEQDLIFDEDDQLVEIVEGYTEEGNTVFEEDQEIFNIMHQVMDDDKTPEQVKKDTEDLLGPDNRNDQKINDIEDVKKEEIDDAQTIDQLKKNGESEADKELGLDKLEDEYHSSATVEEAYKAFFGEEAYDYDAEDEAEGSDTKFGNKELDNTQMPADDIKPTEDENYNSTNDATVKEEYDYDKPDEAEGTDDKFGPKIDNTQMPADDIKPTEDENYNSTNDATVKEDAALEEAFNRWLHEETEQDDAKCECGKPDCPICGKKAELAPDSAPVEDKTDEGRHEESTGENITDADGEGIAPGKVDDNTLPKEDEMTPDCSPEADNGDITDDGDTCDNGDKKEAEAPAPVEKSETDKVDEAFEAWLHENDLEVPILEPNDTIMPDDIEKAEDELEKNAPETNNEIKEEAEVKAEGTTDNMPESDATVPEDEACGKGSGCCGKGSGVEDTSVDEAFEAWLHEEDDMEDSGSDTDDEEKSDPPTNDESLDEAAAFEAWLHEEDEVAEVPDKSDVADAAAVEAEDTGSELDDDLAAVADDDSTAGGDAGLDYDPSDEELLELIGGDED